MERKGQGNLAAIEKAIPSPLLAATTSSTASSHIIEQAILASISEGYSKIFSKAVGTGKTATFTAAA